MVNTDQEFMDIDLECCSEGREHGAKGKNCITGQTFLKITTPRHRPTKYWDLPHQQDYNVKMDYSSTRCKAQSLFQKFLGNPKDKDIRVTLRLWPLSLQPPLNTAQCSGRLTWNLTLMVCYPQLLLPSKYCLAFSKKLPGVTKGKKIKNKILILKRQNNHQNQAQIWQIC